MLSSRAELPAMQFRSCGSVQDPSCLIASRETSHGNKCCLQVTALSECLRVGVHWHIDIDKVMKIIFVDRISAAEMQVGKGHTAKCVTMRDPNR